MRVSERSGFRPVLLFHPAGVFFPLAAAIAVVLPWLWLFPLTDPRLAHVRLGLFGFGGMTICGYVMTAQRAWTGRSFPVPALLVGALALGARLASLGFPDSRWPIILLSFPMALMILWPVSGARRWDKVPLAMVPLMMVAAEAMVVEGWDIAGSLPIAISILIFLVGSRLVSSFTAEAHVRRGLVAPRRPQLWLGRAVLSIGFVDRGDLGTSALLAAISWIMAVSLPGLRLGQANGMLCIGYAGLIPGLLAMAAARSGLVPPLVHTHALSMAAMGPMILAVAARVTMRRIVGRELLPRRRHWIALVLLFGAAIVRGLAEVLDQRTMWLTTAGFGWSLAWVLFLSVHLQALLQPAPFPLLSAERASRLKS